MFIYIYYSVLDYRVLGKVCDPDRDKFIILYIQDHCHVPAVGKLGINYSKPGLSDKLQSFGSIGTYIRF